MPATEPPETPVADADEPIVRPSRAPRERTEARRQPPFAVVLHNDEINGFDYVISVLRKVFHYGRMKAFWMTLQAHVSGCGVVWTGSLEVAELKADQLRSSGPDPRAMHRGALPLRVTVEPLPVD
jgi:ATP-dependent Clp protease adaptor protein ClpS